MACVLLPYARWLSFPPGASFERYLDGPLHDYFLGQSLVELGEDWPFGEWSHGVEGVRDFFAELLGTEADVEINRFLFVIGRRDLRGHWDCPCGSGLKIKRCCGGKILSIRRRFPASVANEARERLGFDPRPYKGRRALAPLRR